jgi:hypothetical protein
MKDTDRDDSCGFAAFDPTRRAVAMGRPISRYVQIALRLAKVFHSAAHSAVPARACRPTRQALA